MNDGWMERWIDGWMDGQMNGWMDGQMNGWMDGQMNGQNAPKSCNGSLIMHNCDYHIHMNIYSQRGTWNKNLS